MKRTLFLLLSSLILAAPAAVQAQWPMRDKDVYGSRNGGYSSSRVNVSTYTNAWSLAGASLPLTGDVLGSGTSQLVASVPGGIGVFDGIGTELDFIATGATLACLADVNLDGVLEILAVQMDTNYNFDILVYQADGTLLKTIVVAGTGQGDQTVTPMFAADLEGTGQVEIVSQLTSGYGVDDGGVRGFELTSYATGQSIWRNVIGPAPNGVRWANAGGNSNLLAAAWGPANDNVGADGTVDNANYTWSYAPATGALNWLQSYASGGFLDSGVYLPDLNGDGTREIVATTSEHGWSLGDYGYGGLQMLNPTNGAEMAEFNLGHYIDIDNAAFGDLDGVPGDEIVVASYEGTSPFLLAFGSNLTATASYSRASGLFIPVAVADLAGTGAQQVLAVYQPTSGNDTLVILNGALTQVLWENDFGAQTIQNVVVDDLNQDGRLDIIVALAPGSGAGQVVVLEPSSIFTTESGLTNFTIYSTGLDDQFNPLPTGTQDPHYVIISAPDGTAATPFAAYAVETNGYPVGDGGWLNDDSYSLWVTPQPSYGFESQDPMGSYDFRTTFDLTGFDPATAEITFQAIADNQLEDVLVNGISSISNFPAPSDFETWFGPYVISSNFVAGTNTLDFIVYNSQPDGGNPCGLRVKISGTASNTTLTSGGLGSLTVTLLPDAAVAAGAEWQLDGAGPWQTNGAVMANVPPGTHSVSFKPIAGWNIPADQTVTITSGVNTPTNVLYTLIGTSTSGALTVDLLPAALRSAAQWQVDGGPNQTSGATVANLAAGSHTLSFTSVSNWDAPSNQVVTITDGVTALASGIYTSNAPSAELVLLTNGSGTIQHATWSKKLKIGTKYTVTAGAKARNVFIGWVGGTNPPYSMLSTSPVYKFTMASNLVVVANFATNVFLEAEGTYRGLFAPESSMREQSNSGSFSFSVTSGGAISGTLDLSGEKVPLSGKFDLGGAALIVSKKIGGIPSLTTALQLDFADQSVSGAISNAEFSSQLRGDRAVFSSSYKASLFEGQYTFIIPGTNDSLYGPFGASYGTVKVDSLGNITLAGSLADGTPLSQSTKVSKEGLWPFYVNLYGGKGSLWGWNYFTNHTITGAYPLSWINATNASKTAVCRSGFTNQEATLVGENYLGGQKLPPGLTVELQLDNPPLTITIPTLPRNADKLTLTTNKTTGVISGSFANPAVSKKTIKVGGVILQSQASAQGYFLGTNQSGLLLIEGQ